MRMLAATDASPDLALNGNPHADANLDLDLDLRLDISSATQRRVAESVSQELDYWERLVFSFDMERDPGGPSQSESSSSTRGRAKKRGERAQTPAVPSTSAGPPRSSSNTGQRHGHQSVDSQHASNLSFPPTFPSAPGQAPNTQLPQSNQPPGLDPYILAHLAALSILQQAQNAPGTQSHNPADPAAVLRQLQGLLFPYAGTSQRTPGPNTTTTSFPQGFSHLQPQESSSHFPSSGSQQTAQSPLTDSPGQRWPPHVPGAAPFPFPMLPIDPSLAGHLPQLSPLMIPNMYTPPAQTSGAGSSSGASRARSKSMTSAGSPATPTSPADARARSLMDEAAIIEDKRRRNTTASARFRIKKKHKTLALERSVTELEARADDLEREASELRRENGWLKEMLIMKGRSVRAQAVAIATKLAQEDDEEEEEEVSGDDDEEVKQDDEKEPEDVADKKGKGKEKAI